MRRPGAPAAQPSIDDSRGGKVKVAGLFAGIGGIEKGLIEGHGAVETEMLCEWWHPAQSVLREHFSDTQIEGDVAKVRSLPKDLDLVTAGFPCTDLSQAGRTAGITGKASGMVGEVFRLLEHQKRAGRLPDLLIENVPNMLVLDRGHAMRHLVEELEKLGYAWAYRTVDTRFTGLPQRRRRVILLASARSEPETVLMADDAGVRPLTDYTDDAYGFYWTEGNRGVGWAQDAIPTLKGSSTLGIPSPPAIWLPGADLPIVIPSLEDAEALQGFQSGWTNVPLEGLTPARERGARWKMLGNAVTTRVAEWVGERLAQPGEVTVESTEALVVGRWPAAAWGGAGQVWQARASEFPVHRPYQHLRDVAAPERSTPLSDRALLGFTTRLLRSSLKVQPAFKEALIAECLLRDLLLVAPASETVEGSDLEARTGAANTQSSTSS